MKTVLNLFSYVKESLFGTTPNREVVLASKKRKPKKKKRWVVFDVLSKQKGPLTIDEVLVLCYRKHDVVLDRMSVMSCLSSLYNEGKIARVQRGVYVRVKNENINTKN